jgi:hypothetical protein
MIKVLTLVFVFILFSFGNKNNNYKAIVNMVTQEFKINIENSTVILINNRICKGNFCGSNLNKYLIKNIPRNTTDSIYFLIAYNDMNLIDTLNRYSKGRIISFNNNILYKYGIYVHEYIGVRLKNNKIKKSTNIYESTRFNKWDF